MKKTCHGLALGILLGLLSGQATYANPNGAQVAHGQVSITQPDPATLNIRNSNGAIINWQQFSNQQNEVTRFIQDSANSAILNRVVGQDPSSILGQLLSNGRVFLINPNGIVFGPNSIIDTAGLVASTLDMSDEDFINQNLKFQGYSAADIKNQGYIKAGANGDIFLIAPNIENSGILETDGGEIVLAAGKSLTIASLESDHLVFDVQAPDHTVLNLGQLLTHGGAARIFAGTIKNHGSVNANSISIDRQGRIVLSASDDVQLTSESVISASGSDTVDAGSILISAHNIARDNNGSVYLQGEIQAEGETGGQVRIVSDSLLVDGRVSVDGVVAAGDITTDTEKRTLVTHKAHLSAVSATGKAGAIRQVAAESLFSSGHYSATGKQGGRIELLGDEVKLAAAEVDSSGRHQGGEIRVGGGFSGTEPGIVNAQHTQVNGTTTLRADALEAGNAGTIVVWSDRETRFSGRISARGGQLGGDGGTVEVSGKQGLAFNGVVDVSASLGQRGTLLLDPKNITISNLPAGALGLTELVDPNPVAADEFGSFGGSLLSTGNLLIAEPTDDFAALDAGAVYLFNPDSGALLATLTGAQADDLIGDSSITTLSNGDYVVASRTWDNAAVIDAGAVTWGDGNVGISGVVNATNSLVGTSDNDEVGNSITALTNGNFVVTSINWDDGASTDVGAVTWANGLGGTVGAVSAANSLIGSTASDFAGSSGVTPLGNGNYVVASNNWDNGAASNAGAVTWGNGLGGTIGAISAANSLVGTTSNDQLGAGNITVLSNNNYVVGSQLWDNGAVVDAGAATWANGLGGTVGSLSAANSLVGTTASDRISSQSITALSNGNYVVASTIWDNGGVVNAGAATWGDGSTAGPRLVGAVSAANSLVGSTTLDRIGLGVTALTNGNYVVGSSLWDNGPIVDAGAATWGNGLGGTVGAVTPINSLVGTTANDNVGSVTALTNGNYVVVAALWDDGPIIDVGSATWADGLGTTVGAVTSANSLVGTTANDRVGITGITPLSNGNYVVQSRSWDNAAATDAGAATWGNGLGGTVGAVTPVNSLVGSTLNDDVGISVLALNNGNYVVRSSNWNNGAATDAGAATWGDGTSGVTGAVSAVNSLVGTSSNDNVSSNDLIALNNGNYVVVSSSWDNGGISDAGAVTWGDGSTGVSGAVSAGNSLVGTSAADFVGTNGVFALSNGNFVAISSLWDNAAIVNAGAATFVDGTTGITGSIDSSNSLLGAAANDQIGSNGIVDLGTGKFSVFSGNVDNLAGVDAGQVTVVAPAAGALVNNLFTDLAASDVTISNASIKASLDLGSPVVLQANNDIIQSAGADILVSAGGAGGNLTLQAGRSVIFNANITTDNGDLLVLANNAAGVDAQRDAGAAEILMADGTILDAGAGNISLEVGNGPATENDSGNMTLERLIGLHIDLTIEGSSANSSILRASNDALISASSLFVDHDPVLGPGGGSVGTLAEPLRVAVFNLAAHTHLSSPGIFFDSVSTSTTTIGNTFFGDLHGIRGLETTVDGDIVLNAVAGITVLQDIRLAGSSLTLNAGTALAGDLVFDAEAAFADAESDSTIEVLIGSTAGNTGSAVLTGDNIRFLGANSDTSSINLRLRGSGDLSITADTDIIVQAGTGGGTLDSINIISGDLTAGVDTGGAMNLIATTGEIRVESPAGAQQFQALIQANNGKQTLNAGSNITLDAGPQANSIVNIQANGLVSSGLQQEVLLNQDGSVGEGLLLMKAGGGLNNQTLLVAANGDHSIDSKGPASGIILQTDGTAGTGKVEITAGVNQTITSAGNGNIAVLPDNIPVQILAFTGTQTINAGSGGLNIQSLGSQPGTVSGVNQDIDAAFLQVISSSLAGGTATLRASGGTQDIATTNGQDNSIFVAAGSAAAATIDTTTGNQIINTNGGLRLLGGGGVSGSALVQAQTGQSINALFIDVIGSTGSAIIDTNGGLQDINTSGLNAAGGAVAGINEGILVDATGTAVAAIHSDGSQDISVVNSDLVRVVATVGNADITSAGTQLLSVTGTGNNAIEIGDIAGGVSAGLSLIGGIQTITAGTGAELGSISMRAGTTGSADSRFTSAANQIISTTGNFTMTGGSGGSADADLDAPTGLLDLDVGGNLILTGGTGTDSQAEINVGTLDLNVTADMNLNPGSNSNTDSSIFTAGNNTTVVGGTLTLTGGPIEADVEINSGGNIILSTGSNLNISGGTGLNAEALLLAETLLDLTIGGDLNLTSGSGQDSDATAESNSTVLTANVTGAVNLISGSGTDADVELAADTGLDLTVGKDLTLDAILGGQNAFIFVGMSNANIAAVPTAPLTITTGTISDGNVFLRGGAQTDTAIDLQGGITSLDIGGNLDLIAGTAASTSVEIDQASIIDIDVGGNLTMIGGSNTDAAALIGENNAGVTVTIGKNAPIGGNITLTAGTNLEGLAAIGSTCIVGPCPANVTINGGAGVILNSNTGDAFIGSLTQDTGNLTVKAGLLGPGDLDLGDGRLLTDGPITLENLAAGGQILDGGSQVDAGSGIFSATTANGLLQIPQIAASNLQINSTSGNINLSQSITTAAPVSINAGTGNFTMANPTQINSASDISISGNDLTLNSTGLTDLTSPTRVTLTATGQVTNLGATGGTPDVDSPTLVINAQNGVELDIDANDLNINNTVAGSVNIIDTGGSLTANVVNAGRPVSVETEQGPLAIGVINGSTVTLLAATTAGVKSISDANGAALNITATNLNFSALNGFGSFADPIEIVVSNPFTVNTSLGEIGIIQSGNLQLLGNTTTTGNIRLGANGGELLIQDQLISSSTGTIRLSGSSVRVQAIGSTTFVNAGADIELVNTGDLILQGSNTSNNASAKLFTSNNVTITAGNVSLIAGDADDAIAGIDPLLINMTLSGDLNITGGAGNRSEANLEADNIILNLLGNLNLAGGAGPDAFATINANADLTISSGIPTLPGNVFLTPGTGPNADAVFIANSGTGNVNINAGVCNICTILSSDPFSNPASQAGIFGNFAFTLLVPPPVAPVTEIPDGTNQIIVLDDTQLMAFGPGGFLEEDQTDEGVERLMTCR